MTQSNPFRKQVLTLLGEHYSDKTLVLCPTVFVRLLNGDHKAAILLSQILYWCDRTKDKEGWFYKSMNDWQLETGLSDAQVRRIVKGDKRVKTRQITLRDVGVETVLKKVKRTGAPTVHYRINQTVFLAALQSFIEQGDSPHCSASTPDNAANELPAVPEMNTDQSTDSLIPSETSTTDQQTVDHDHQNDDDLMIFHPYEQRFGKLKETSSRTFRSELKRLGSERVGEVLERCASRGRSWNYVVKALASEASPETAPAAQNSPLQPFLNDWRPDAPERACEAPTPDFERLNASWQNSAKTVQEVWESAFQQMEAQIDRTTFVSYLRDAVLVDFEPETKTFLLAVRNVSARDALQHRLQRTLQRILGDVCGQAVTVQTVLSEEWTRQGERIA